MRIENDRVFFRSLSRHHKKSEGWAKQQKDKPSRSEAIRRLIEIALTAKSKRQSTRGEK